MTISPPRLPAVRSLDLLCPLYWLALALRGIALCGWVATSAALIMGVSHLGLGAMLLGLIAVVPMLGHASWHAYRDLVDVSSLPPREPG